jgi:hypothetical protein
LLQSVHLCAGHAFVPRLTELAIGLSNALRARLQIRMTLQLVALCAGHTARFRVAGHGLGLFGNAPPSHG